MKQKLLACDVDGTLVLNHDQHIDSRDLLAIRRFREAGNLFVLCTGRTEVWTTPLLRDFDLQTDGLILCNGSMVYEVSPSKPDAIRLAADRSISGEIGRAIIKHFYDLGDFSIYWDDGEHTCELKDRLFSTDNSIVQDLNTRHISIEELMGGSSNFVTIGMAPYSASADTADKYKQYILQNWDVNVFRNQYFIDIAPPDSSKGAGLEAFVKMQNKNLEVYAVGDSYNDIPMFQYAGSGNSFLIKSGAPDIAPYTLHSVKNVAECIDIIMEDA